MGRSLGSALCISIHRMAGSVKAQSSDTGDHPQGLKHVTIPLPPRTGRALNLYIGERTLGPIFLGVEGGRMDRYAPTEW